MNRKSKFESPRWILGGALCLAAAGLQAAAPTPSPTPAPTATPRPKLGGGFGRAASTPVAAADPSAQSLADVVRATKLKEPGQKKAGVTIDNSTLVTDPTKGRLTTAAPARPPAVQPTPAARGTAAQALPAAAATPPPAASAASAAEEQRWREASRAARKRVDDVKQRIEELDASAHKLESDFYAWDDGQYRDRVIKPAWDKTKADLEAARRELAEAEKSLADLPELARKAGALPGWLRE